MNTLTKLVLLIVIVSAIGCVSPVESSKNEFLAAYAYSMRKGQLQTEVINNLISEAKLISRYEYCLKAVKNEKECFESVFIKNGGYQERVGWQK